MLPTLGEVEQTINPYNLKEGNYIHCTVEAYFALQVRAKELGKRLSFVPEQFNGVPIYTVPTASVSGLGEMAIFYDCAHKIDENELTTHYLLNMKGIGSVLVRTIDDLDFLVGHPEIKTLIDFEKAKAQQEPKWSKPN